MEYRYIQFTCKAKEMHETYLIFITDIISYQYICFGIPNRRTVPNKHTGLITIDYYYT